MVDTRKVAEDAAMGVFNAVGNVFVAGSEKVQKYAEELAAQKLAAGEMELSDQTVESVLAGKRQVTKYQKMLHDGVGPDGKALTEKSKTNLTERIDQGNAQLALYTSLLWDENGNPGQAVKDWQLKNRRSLDSNLTMSPEWDGERLKTEMDDAEKERKAAIADAGRRSALATGNSERITAESQALAIERENKKREKRNQENRDNPKPGMGKIFSDATEGVMNMTGKAFHAVAPGDHLTESFTGTVGTVASVVKGKWEEFYGGLSPGAQGSVLGVVGAIAAAFGLKLGGKVIPGLGNPVFMALGGLLAFFGFRAKSIEGLPEDVVAQGGGTHAPGQQLGSVNTPAAPAGSHVPPVAPQTSKEQKVGALPGGTEIPTLPSSLQDHVSGKVTEIGALAQGSGQHTIVGIGGMNTNVAAMSHDESGKVLLFPSRMPQPVNTDDPSIYPGIPAEERDLRIG